MCTWDLSSMLSAPVIEFGKLVAYRWLLWVEGLHFRRRTRGVTRRFVIFCGGFTPVYKLFHPFCSTL